MRHDDTAVALTRNVLALVSGLLLWTAGHFGVLAVLPLFLHDQGYDARSIGFTLGATGVAQLCVRPFAGCFSAFLPLWAIGRGVGNPGILFVGSQVGAAASRLLVGRLADRYGRRIVLAPAMGGVAATLIGMSVAVGLPAFFILAIGYGALYGVAFVVLPALVGEAAPPEGRAAAMNTFGLGADLAQLLGPWGLGLAGGAWGFGGALIAAGAVPLLGAAAYLAQLRCTSAPSPCPLP
jgi:MFS family permease